MRYFMSVEEAVQLVLQASLMADRGDVFMLEMGEPMNIADLARRMIRLSGFQPGTDIPIRIIGTRPGERLHEELFDVEEHLMTTAHPSILRLVASGDLSTSRLDAGVDSLRLAAFSRDEEATRQILFDLISDHEGQISPFHEGALLHQQANAVSAEDEIPA
jgi:FlaA1/EpsC-like NDP-sugar epimerase